MTVMRSPNEVMATAMEAMESVPPTTREAQETLLHFILAQIVPGLGEQVGRVMVMLYPDQLGLLSEDDVARIAAFQERRGEADDLG